MVSRRGTGSSCVVLGCLGGKNGRFHTNCVHSFSCKLFFKLAYAVKRFHGRSLAEKHSNAE
jgi:hypothetical protein